MAQRMAIVQSNKYHIWSLSWKDVENKFKSQNDFFMDFMEPDGFPSGTNFKAMLKGYNIVKYKKLIKCNSFDLLIKFLEIRMKRDGKS